MCAITGQVDEGEAQEREACNSSEGERETDMLLLLVVCLLSVFTGETSPPHTNTNCWFVFVQPDQSPASRTVFGFRLYSCYT